MCSWTHCLLTKAAKHAIMINNSFLVSVVYRTEQNRYFILGRLQST